MALHVIVQANMDLEVFFKTKIIRDVYTPPSSDYNMLVLKAPINHQGGVALFFRNSPHCQIAANQCFVSMSSASSWRHGGRGVLL